MPHDLRLPHMQTDAQMVVMQTTNQPKPCTALTTANQYGWLQNQVHAWIAVLGSSRTAHAASRGKAQMGVQLHVHDGNGRKLLMAAELLNHIRNLETSTPAHSRNKEGIKKWCWLCRGCTAP
jgi:hypothetical protein